MALRGLLGINGAYGRRHQATGEQARFNGVPFPKQPHHRQLQAMGGSSHAADVVQTSRNHPPGRAADNLHRAIKGGATGKRGLLFSESYGGPDKDGGCGRQSRHSENEDQAIMENPTEMADPGSDCPGHT